MLDAPQHSVNTRRRIAAYLLVGVLVVVLNALSFRTLDQPIWVGAAVGLAWTLLAIPVAAWVNRRRARLGHWPDTVALLAAANAAVVVGFGLLLDLTFPDASSYLAMNQTAAGPNHSFAYGLVNTPREWLLVPLAVLVTGTCPGAGGCCLGRWRCCTWSGSSPTCTSPRRCFPGRTQPPPRPPPGCWTRSAAG
jgi:hypothetical protein